MTEAFELDSDDGGILFCACCVIADRRTVTTVKIEGFA